MRVDTPRRSSWGARQPLTQFGIGGRARSRESWDAGPGGRRGAGGLASSLAADATAPRCARLPLCAPSGPPSPSLLPIAGLCLQCAPSLLSPPRPRWRLGVGCGAARWPPYTASPGLAPARSVSGVGVREVQQGVWHREGRQTAASSLRLLCSPGSARVGGSLVLRAIAISGSCLPPTPPP